MAKTQIKRNSTQASIRKAIKERMEKLGTYSPEFDIVINVFADTIRQYNLAFIQFENEGLQYEVETTGGSTKKSGTAAALETLRKDIGTYSDRLLLNPKSFKDIDNKDSNASKLDKVIDSFFDG